MGDQPQHIPLGAITKSDAVRRTIEAYNEGESGGNDGEKIRKPWIKQTALRRLAEIAKEFGAWIDDVTPLTDDNGILNKGTENTV